MDQIKIDNRHIGDDKPCFVIAEIGNNHNGSVKEAFKLIDVAVEASCDAVKFQLFKGKDIVLPLVKVEDYPDWRIGKKYINWIDFLDSLSLSFSQFREILKYAKKKKIFCIVTPCSEEAIDFLENQGVLAYKVASMDITNIPLLERINFTSKPVILSCGMASFKEIEKAISTLFCCEIILLHCVSKYPLHSQEANLNRISELKKRFHLSVGFSDHSLGIDLACKARGTGACCIEKHITLRCNQRKKAEHHFSLEPQELKDLVHNIHQITPNFKKTFCSLTSRQSDLEVRKIFRRGWWYGKNLKKGDIVRKSDVLYVRPENPFWPDSSHSVLSRILKDDVRIYEPVKKTHLGRSRLRIEVFNKKYLGDLVPQLVNLDNSAVYKLGHRYEFDAWKESNFLVDLPGKWKYSQVAFIERQIVGFWISSKIGKDTLHTHRVLVDEKYRNCQIGRKMFTSILRQVKLSCIFKMTLEVSVDGILAQEFYKKLGFYRCNSEEVLQYLKSRRRVGTRCKGNVIIEENGHKTHLFMKKI